MQAEKDRIKTLIADISHQTKTPIANILLYTQLLREQPLPAESHLCVDSLERQSIKLQSLIDALVKTSRLESGIIALQPSSWNLASVIKAAISQVQPKADEKDISIIIDCSDAEAVFDPKWTEEAVFNLLDNAVKFCPQGGTLGIIGATGSGKSTLLRCMNLLEEPTYGEVWIENDLLTAPDPYLHFDVIKKSKTFASMMKKAKAASPDKSEEELEEEGLIDEVGGISKALEKLKIMIKNV